MTALLGLLAVAGYQNRDKLSEMLGNRGAAAGTGAAGRPARRRAGRLARTRRTAGRPRRRRGRGGLGGLLGGGLSELNERFRQNGHGETVDSWVGPGPNRSVAPRDPEQAIGPDVLDDLTQQTGLSRDEILSRLSRELPQAVDQYTPHWSPAERRRLEELTKPAASASARRGTRLLSAHAA
jgi:uncharacterized protein YidB (DUF937 family)